METPIVTVPKGMSYVNAAYALWLKAETPSFVDRAENHPTLQSILHFFHLEVWSSLGQGKAHIHTMHGRRIDVSFGSFPDLTLSHYGSMTAERIQEALAEYNKIPSNERLDPNDQQNYSQNKKLIV
ncbi:MAG: hypothetical protein KDK64_07260 [Chlamydiia bacterium]|nr:hypothetical protein [Chlamydiia bacterium]